MKTPYPRKGLPANAKRVFKGIIFEVWQWEQEMFDGTKEIFERIWRPPTVEVIATAGDKIIIEYQAQPDRQDIISLVSGRIGDEEDPLEGAKRELAEETGYQSSDWSLLMKHGVEAKVLHEVYYFIAKNCQKIREPQLDAGEKIETKLITFDELLNLTDEPRFWVPPQFIYYLGEARRDPNKREELRKLIFKK